jgi:hypothetical protein
MKKLKVASLAQIIGLGLVTLQGNSVLARSNAYNQGYWITMNTRTEDILMTIVALNIPICVALVIDKALA